jgi:hypothetical protein
MAKTVKKEKKKKENKSSGGVKKKRVELKVQWKKKATGLSVKTRTTSVVASKPLSQAGPSHQGTKLGRTWNAAHMKQAWLELQEPGNRMSKRGLQQKYNLPKSTFMDRCVMLEKRVKDGLPITDDLFGLLSGGKSTPRLFTPEEEIDLAEYIVQLSKSGFPIEPSDFRSLAHEYALALGKFVSLQNDQLSYNWYYAFLDRHPRIFVKEPKEMCLYRAIAPNEQNYGRFHEKYQKLVNELNIDEEHVWNVDETGLIDNPVSTTVLTERGSNHPYIVPQERGTTTTVVTYINAAGMHCPPMVIMKGKNVQERWKEYMPPYVHLRASPNGWIDAELFYQYGNIFYNWLKSRRLLDKQNLVVMDGHGSHSYNHPFLMVMKNAGIEVLSLPPHSSHFLQPLDQAPFHILKGKWKKNLRSYNRRHCGQQMSKQQFFLPFTKTWRAAINTETIIAGWRKTGLWPVNKERICKDVFSPAENICKRT